MASRKQQTHSQCLKTKHLFSGISGTRQEFLLEFLTTEIKQRNKQKLNKTLKIKEEDLQAKE